MRFGGLRTFTDRVVLLLPALVEVALKVSTFRPTLFSLTEMLTDLVPPAGITPIDLEVSAPPPVTLTFTPAAMASPPLVTFTEKVGLPPFLVLEGPETVTLVIFADGKATVKLRVAGLGSMFPAASWARKLTVWDPMPSEEKVLGLVQSAKAALSSWHWILAVSPAVPWKAKVAELTLIVPEGPESMTVSGGVVSGGGVVVPTVWVSAGEAEAWNSVLPE